MTDLIDRANIEADALLDEKIRQVTKGLTPNDTTDCIDCGELIGIERKQALPWAIRCIKCQTALEKTK